MKEIAASLLALLGNPPKEVAALTLAHDDWRVKENAFLRFGDHAVIFLAEKPGEMRLGIVALREKYLPDGFVGERELLPGGAMLLSGACERKNAAALRRHCPKCAPSAPDVADVVIPATDFAGSEGDFLLFTGDEANLCILRDRLTFAAFADGMRKKYALGGAAKDPSAAARLLDCGASYVVFTAPENAMQLLPVEYRDRRFVLTAQHAVKAEGALFPAETIREAEKIARLAAAHHAAWALQMPGVLPVAEHLAVARELYVKNAVPRQLIAAADEKSWSDHAAIAARYGKYEFKTV